jgi:hypothetical protein
MKRKCIFTQPSDRPGLYHDPTSCLKPRDYITVAQYYCLQCSGASGSEHQTVAMLERQSIIVWHVYAALVMLEL